MFQLKNRKFGIKMQFFAEIFEKPKKIQTGKTENSEIARTFCQNYILVVKVFRKHDSPVCKYNNWHENPDLPKFSKKKLNKIKAIPVFFLLFH